MAIRKTLKPTKHNVCVGITPELMEKIKVAAEADRRTIKNFLENLIALHVEGPRN